MDIGKIVQEAWSKTVEDFETAIKQSYAAQWTENTLRLTFVRRLCESSKVGRLLADPVCHMGKVDYEPDIIVDIAVDGVTKSLVFEMKFFGSVKDWKSDLEKLTDYSRLDLDLGYFLAIGSPKQCDGIQNEFLQKKQSKFGQEYEIKLLTYRAKNLGENLYRFLQDVVKLSVDISKIPYFVSTYGFWAKVILPKVVLNYYLMENSVAVFATAAQEEIPLPKTIKEKSPYYKWIYFDNKDEMQTSETATNSLLIAEYKLKERQLSEEVAKELKPKIEKFINEIP